MDASLLENGVNIAQVDVVIRAGVPSEVVIESGSHRERVMGNRASDQCEFSLPIEIRRQLDHSATYSIKLSTGEERVFTFEFQQQDQRSGKLIVKGCLK